MISKKFKAELAEARRLRLVLLSDLPAAQDPSSSFTWSNEDEPMIFEDLEDINTKIQKLIEDNDDLTDRERFFAETDQL